MDQVVTLLFIGVAMLLGRATAVPSPAQAAVEVTPLQYRENRLFFPFIIISPDACNTTSSTYTKGLCYSPSDCSNLGGTGAGNCAKGLGVCCYFTKTCGGTATSNGTRFLNPNSPGKDTRISNCVLTVDLINDNICQLRLDFVDFVLVKPNLFGQCETDFMTVTGTSNDANVPKLCGTNTGKHMYVDVDPTGGNPKINIDTGSTTDQRSWDINVTQIACDSPNKAPAGCRQYYTESSGVVESFDYVIPTAEGIAAQTANQHLANLNYAVCIASRPGYCSVTWSQNHGTSNNPYTFMMTGDGTALAPTTAGTLGASLSGAACTTDYVMIPSGSFTNAASITEQADRFCGLGFPTQVVSTMQPNVMYVVTDSSEPTSIDPGDISNVGFSLQYRQNACN